MIIPNGRLTLPIGAAAWSGCRLKTHLGKINMLELNVKLLNWLPAIHLPWPKTPGVKFIGSSAFPIFIHCRCVVVGPWVHKGTIITMPVRYFCVSHEVMRLCVDMVANRPTGRSSWSLDTHFEPFS